MRIPGNVTRTYAMLEVSASVYDEIAEPLLAAGYDAINPDGTLDLHGIALVKEEAPWRKGNCERCGALIYLDHAHICNTERTQWEIAHEPV